MSTPFRLQVPRGIFDALLAQADAELPNECCGMLAGVIEAGIGRVTKRYAYTNVAATPTTRYDAAPHELFAAERDMRQQQLVQLAIYHSHPTSAPIPSQTDLERGFPGSVYLIISLQGRSPVIRGWWLAETAFAEADWAVEP